MQSQLADNKNNNDYVLEIGLPGQPNLKKGPEKSLGNMKATIDDITHRVPTGI